MQVAIDQFRVNIARVRNLGVIHNTLNTQTTAVIDLSDLSNRLLKQHMIY